MPSSVASIQVDIEECLLVLGIHRDEKGGLGCDCDYCDMMMQKHNELVSAKKLAEEQVRPEARAKIPKATARGEIF